MPFYAVSKSKNMQIRCNRFLFRYFLNVNLLHWVQDTNGAQWKFVVNIHLAPKYASFLCYFYIHEYVVHNLQKISKRSPGTSRLERDNALRITDYHTLHIRQKTIAWFHVLAGTSITHWFTKALKELMRYI